MRKTLKELAFLRELYINDEWTRRFTDLVDRHIGFSSDERKILYINAGTGNHAFALRDKVSKDAAFFATGEDEDVLIIARDKALALKSDIDFSMTRFNDDTFDAVLADASFVRPPDLKEFVEETARVTEPGGKVVFFTVSAGSFGEIFSLLWEVFFTQDLSEHCATAERLITEIPTISQIETIASRVGLKNLETHLSSEIFEYANGAEFVNSVLVGDFLLPVWLESLSEEDKARAIDKLARLIDSEDGEMSFRFSVKAALVTGEKERK